MLAALAKNLLTARVRRAKHRRPPESSKSAVKARDVWVTVSGDKNGIVQSAGCAGSLRRHCVAASVVRPRQTRCRGIAATAAETLWVIHERTSAKPILGASTTARTADQRKNRCHT